MNRLRRAFYIASMASMFLPGTIMAATPADHYATHSDTVFYDPTDGCTGSTTSTLTGNGPLEQTYNYLVGKGFTPAQASGIIGNFIAESGIGSEVLQGHGGQVTTAQQVVSMGLRDASTGWGLAQWTPPSKIITTNRPNANVNTLGYQLDFLWSQLQSTEKTAFLDVKGANTPKAAAFAWMVGYERPADQSPGGPNAIDRETLAQAVYDYAVNHKPLPQSVSSRIVSNSNSGSTTPGGASCGGGPSGPCQNPLRDIKGLVPERIDMGVDYGGTGPVHPICDATVVSVATSGSGWPGLGTSADGAFIVYKLKGNVGGKNTTGKLVYYSEDCIPKVHKGQEITVNDVLCQQVNEGTTIETGWASPTALGTAYDYQWYHHPDPDGTAEPHGQNFSAMMKVLGAPGGNIDASYMLSPRPIWPAGWPTWPTRY